MKNRMCNNGVFLCSRPMKMTTACSGFSSHHHELPVGIYNQEAETKDELTSQEIKNKTQTAWKHLFKVFDVKWPPCSGFIPDVSTVVNSPPPHSIDPMQKKKKKARSVHLRHKWGLVLRFDSVEIKSPVLQGKPCSGFSLFMFLCRAVLGSVGFFVI